MNSLKILIVEDNIITAHDMENHLNKIGHKSVYIAKNDKSAIQKFRIHQPELVILDVQLDGSKKNGIEIAQEINTIKKVPILFLTALNNSSIKEQIMAINPANYLSKPWSPQQLETAVDFAFHNFKKEELQSPNSTSDFKNCFNIGDFFYIKRNNKYCRIDVNQIIWVKAAGSCIEIHTIKEKILFYSNLNSFFSQVSHPNLLRIHKSHVINIKYVVSFNASRVNLKVQDYLMDLSIGQKYKPSFNSTFIKLKTD